MVQAIRVGGMTYNKNYKIQLNRSIEQTNNRNRTLQNKFSPY